jgi:hypothetical protein
MNLTLYERRRLAVLAVVTSFLVVIFFAVGNGSSNNVITEGTDIATPSSIGTTTTSTPLSNANAVGPLADDASKPVNLDGPLAQQPTGDPAIAYPGPGEMNRVNARASYMRYPDYNSAICYSAAAPLGSALIITNLNNGKSIACTNVFAIVLPAGIDVIVHTPLFLQIANLVDAPLPVTVSW